MRTLEVELAGERHVLTPGQEFTMGRVGDLVIDDNPYLHRSFLKLSYAEGFWWVANIGSRATAQLSDAGGLSRSTLTPGVKMPLVFARTVVTFTAGSYCYELNLTTDDPAYEPVVAEPPVGGISGHFLTSTFGAAAGSAAGRISAFGVPAILSAKPMLSATVMCG